MASTDYPFSVSSKFVDDSGTEHLVTIRGRNLEDFSSRLSQASSIFPYAGFHSLQATPTHQPEEDFTPTTDSHGNVGPPTPLNPVAASADRLSQEARVREVKATATKNGDVPVCPQHQRKMLSSKFDGGFYCPSKDGDVYCQHSIAA